jgi:hypothetical protein
MLTFTVVARVGEQVLLMDSEEVQDQLRSLGEDAEDADQDQQDAHTGEELQAAVTHQHHRHQHHQHALHSQPPSARAAAVIALAEKYFDRVDAAQLLELLPEDTAVAALLRYFQIVLEYGSAQRRNLQVRGSRAGVVLLPKLRRGPFSFAYDCPYCFPALCRSSTSCCASGRCRSGRTTNINTCANMSRISSRFVSGFLSSFPGCLSILLSNSNVVAVYCCECALYCWSRVYYTLYKRKAKEHVCQSSTSKYVQHLTSCRLTGTVSA